jgi:hypothetical protein
MSGNIDQKEQAAEPSLVSQTPKTSSSSPTSSPSKSSLRNRQSNASSITGKLHIPGAWPLDLEGEISDRDNSTMSSSKGTWILILYGTLHANIGKANPATS